MLSLLEQGLCYARRYARYDSRATEMDHGYLRQLVFDFKKEVQNTLDSIEAQITHDVKHDDSMGTDESGSSLTAVLIDKEKKPNDNRLFSDYPLYCEGMHKPVLRGYLHLFGSLLLPLALLHLVLEANGNAAGTFAACVYIFCNAWCYGCSALFHMGKWSYQEEIWLQKMDHCGIAVLSSGTMVPLCVLLLPAKIGATFMALSWGFCIWTCYKIFNLRPSYLRQVMVPACIFIFMPYCYLCMNNIEWYSMLSTIGFQMIGMTVFINKFCNFSCNRHLFGYHEIFHMFVCLAGLCVYVCNWSIIRRTCQPYANELDVLDLLHSSVASFMVDRIDR